MHLSVRMAWHDNNWNGKVCCNPEGNTYCTGAHSLLSGRIEKKKNTEYESKVGVKNEYIAKNFNPTNVPPCYWSINAFGDQEFPVEHHHAFNWVPYALKDVIKKNSVITWPFKLSFVHGDKKKKVHGNYWPDLNERINNYINKFKPKESVIFFYANYDNPVSADDMRYLLLGCSEISELPKPVHFPFTEDELKDARKSTERTHNGKKFADITMINFPTLNWMLQFSHDPESSVLLPYREYIKYVEDHPGCEHLLQDIKVIIEEDSLVRAFKYVSMDLDDDKCLYLLYKLRKSIKKAQDHNQQVVKSDFKKEETRINNLIAKIWKKRGIYPSLAFVLNNFNQDLEISTELANAVIPMLSNKNDLLDFFGKVLEEEIPDELSGFEVELLELGSNRIFKKHSSALAKLSLFLLTEHQVEKIIEDKDLLREIETNPYSLYEEYESEEDDLDIPDMQDEPIDVFKVDMGMIPDRKYVERHRNLQNLVEDSPERVRSVVINYLWQLDASGHCYDSVSAVLKDLYDHPLIYKNEIKLDDEALLKLEDDYRDHFIQKLHIKETSENKYLYLQVVKKSEEMIEKIITKLQGKTNTLKKQVDIDTHIKASLGLLKDIVKTQEQKDLFTSERKQLYKNIFTNSFYLLTGKPGAGKTYETSQIIQHLHSIGEDVLILAPTGKAALRLTENIKKYTSLEDVEAKTIDKYIFDKKFGWCYDDWDATLEIADQDKLTIENLIVDESSMLDLNKLSILLSIVKFTDKYPKRIILVGDENQLPPIGFGKPFHDIIQHVQSSDKLLDAHYINLKSNCRQENDENILKLADAFTDKTRCYEEAFNIIDSGEGKKSKGLFVYKWKTKEALNEKVNTALQEVFKMDLEDQPELENDFQKLNVLFGLYDNGYVNNQDFKFKETLQIESLQLLSPYRTGYFGTLGLNKEIQNKFKRKNEKEKVDKYFQHSDKIIRLYNWYTGWGENRKLKLSNGSTGVVTVKPKSFYKDGEKIEYEERKYYFRDSDFPLASIDDEENFDLAYAITVHKSQGSDFRNVFLIIPQKQSLLSKELLYTALTRSKFRLFVFVQDTEENLLMFAKNNSHLVNRNSSIYSEPIDKKAKFIPEFGVTVSSKVEFIIYEALKKSGLKFKYEEPLKMKNLSYKIHPDFTIYLRDGREIYWEHLGMLDTRKYFNDWQGRKKSYVEHGLSDSLITTDDLNGIDQEKLNTLIENIREFELKSTPDNKFSNHHYQLYN
jgi:exodeoxyribonuclease V alpha subunit